MGRKLAQDVALHPEVVGGNAKACVRAGPVVGLARSDLGHVVGPHHAAVVPQAFHHRTGVDAARNDGSPHGSRGAQVPGEAAGVDLGDAGDPPLPEVVVQALLAAPRRPGHRQVPDHEAGDMGPRPFGIDVVEPVVADVG